MRHWILSAAIAAAILASGSSSAGSAQGVISGIYELDEAQRDNAFRAIESAVAGLPDAYRSLARTRLRKSVASGRIRLSIAGDRVGIAYDAKAPIVIWMGQEPVRWKLIPELVFDVSAKRDGEAISLTFHGDDSDRTTTYRNIGQDLVENTVITIPLSTKPIVYSQVFRRANW